MIFGKNIKNFFILFFFASNAFCEGTSLLRLAEKLDSLGEYDRSAVEYLRFAYRYPEDSLSRWSLFRAGRALERHGNLAGARAVYREIIEENPCDSLGFASGYRTALSFLSDGLLNRAIDSKSECNERVDNNFYQSLNYLKGWVYFLGRNYPSAESIFTIIPAEFADSSAIFMCKKSREGMKIPKKSPLLSASMSAIIPGAGRVYIGRWGDAIINLIAVCGTLGGGYALYEKDKNFSVGLLITGCVLYFGNVYGSYVGARWQNEENQQEFYRKTRENVNRRPEELYDY